MIWPITKFKQTRTEEAIEQCLTYTKDYLIKNRIINYDNLESGNISVAIDDIHFQYNSILNKFNGFYINEKSVSFPEFFNNLKLSIQKLKKNATIEIEDYYPHNMQRRYGGDYPAHKELEAILNNNYIGYESLAKKFVKYFDQLRTVSFDPNVNDSSKPFWNNSFFSGIDAVSLYCITSIKKPNLYIEIGSGHSTRFFAEAVKANAIDSKIISIDPEPRSEINALCDDNIRKPLEECDLGIFDTLEEGDFLFFDGSHRVLQNSDNTVFFLEVIPRIKPGVLIHIHDIFWPFDYPNVWIKRMYSEQYVLGAMLLYAPEKFNIIFPNTYLSFCTQLYKIFDPLWETPGFEKIIRTGGSFWFTKI
jgi:hypothetical protein